jgi:Insect cuticle protein
VIFFHFKGFPQAKAIRDNSGYFNQETFFPGANYFNSPQIVSAVQRPILPPTNQIPVPVSIPIKLPAQTFPPPTAAAYIPQPPQTRNQKPIALPPVVTTTTVRPTTTTEVLTPEELEDQAKSAFYKFGTSVHDTINDHEHVREEVREGLQLKGMYSYSDGFFRRTVHYEADEDGYRVTKEEIQPIGDGEGPKFNPKGQAAVKSTLAGDYSITVDDFKLNKKQEDALVL